MSNDTLRIAAKRMLCLKPQLVVVKVLHSSFSRVDDVTLMLCQDEENHVFGRKEKSVLQSKLTKLAIQIGYAGRLVVTCPPGTVFHGVML